MSRKIDILEKYPVLGICGCSGVGKTTLIEALIPLLCRRHLRVVVVKHDAQNVCIDVPGKDSYRFFEAGADVSLFGQDSFDRRHQQGDFIAFIIELCQRYDFVLIEGHATTPVPKIWLLGEGAAVPPDNKGRVYDILARDRATPARVFRFVEAFLQRIDTSVPVWGCVLIGGKSQRMGRPKHLIERKTKTWLEHAVDTLTPFVDQVVLSGEGSIPASLHGLPRLPDASGLAGPMAGILAVMRWQPAVSWLVMACDLPCVEPESLQWLLEQRGPGIDAIMPDLEGTGRIEPLLAWYGYRCRLHLEHFALIDNLKVSRLSSCPGVYHFQPPADIRGSWRNVNTPDELNAL